MNRRLKQLRKSKEVNLTQREFGKRIGVQDTAISKIEKGENGLTEQMILSVCREFNVNEEWLRNGDGKMFIESDDTNISAVVSEFALDELSQVILRAYVEMDANKRSAFNSFAKELANRVMNDSKKKAINGVNDIIDNSSAPVPVKIDLHGKAAMVFNEAFPYIGFGNVDKDTENVVSEQAQKEKFMQMAESEYDKEKEQEISASFAKESDVV